MKYSKTMEDPHLFDSVTLKNLATHLKIDQSYLFKVQAGQHVVSEKQYLRLKKAVQELS